MSSFLSLTDIIARSFITIVNIRLWSLDDMHRIDKSVMHTKLYDT